MRSSRWWRRGVGVLAAIIFSFLVEQIWNSEKQLSFGRTRILASGKPVDIWFFLPDHLVALLVENSVITVKHWDLSGKEPARDYTFDFGSVIDKRPIALSYFRDPNAPAANRPVVPYAVALDGSSIAWAEGAKVYAANFASGRPEEVASLKDGAAAVFFVQPHLLSTIREDGKLEAWDRRSRKRCQAGTWLDGRWSIWSHGPRMALSCFEIKEVGRIDFDEAGDGIKFQLYSIPSEKGSSLAISEGGSVAVGTDWGQVQWITAVSSNQEAERQGGVQPESVDGEPERVQLADTVTALAFYDDQNLFVLVRNGLAHLIHDKFTVSKVPDSPPATLLAVSKQYLALAVGDQTEVTELTLKRKIPWIAVSINLMILLAISAMLAWWPTEKAANPANAEGPRLISPANRDFALWLNNITFALMMVAYFLWMAFDKYDKVLEPLTGMLAGAATLIGIVRKSRTRRQRRSGAGQAESDNVGKNNSSL